MSLFKQLTNVKHVPAPKPDLQKRAKRKHLQAIADQSSAYLLDKEYKQREIAFAGLSRENTPQRIDTDEFGDVIPIANAGYNQRLIEIAYQEMQNYLRARYPLIFPYNKP